MQIRNLVFMLLLTLNLFNCGDTQVETKAVVKSDVVETSAKQVDSKPTSPKIYEKFEDMEHLFHINNDTTYLINFWATWCKPCVQELPLFERLLNELKGEKYKSILVSLDFPNKIESKLIPFIKDNKLMSEVVVLTDGKQQQWIDKVDKDWDGAIPVSLIYKKAKSKFLYGEVHDYEELKKEVLQIMN